MVAIITGDIVNSRSSKHWLSPLKSRLNKYGPSPQCWEIFRGDSFQLEITPEKALLAAIHLKATIKQLGDLDVRMAIGLGQKDVASEKITESNGSAFVNSGTCFDSLKKTNLAIKSPFQAFDDDVNLLLELALLTMNDWAPITAEVILERLEHPELTQTELGALTGRSQSNISEALHRGGYGTIIKMEAAYRRKIKEL